MLRVWTESETSLADDYGLLHEVLLLSHECESCMIPAQSERHLVLIEHTILISVLGHDYGRSSILCMQPETDLYRYVRQTMWALQAITIVAQIIVIPFGYLPCNTIASPL